MHYHTLDHANVFVSLVNINFLVDNKDMIITSAHKAIISKQFVTHNNYAKCMDGMMHGLTISVPTDRTVAINASEIKRFMKLANLTSHSIRGEVLSCHSEADYAQIVAPWITVKCYYRIYYLESVLIHLASGTNEVFKYGGHGYVRKIIKTYCKNGYYQSKMKHAEVVVGTKEALAHRIPAGSNISANYYLTESCVKSVRHKIAEYSQAHWKQNQKHKNFRTAEAKSELLAYNSKNEVSLFDYFYQMRIKASYKDLDFLDFEVISIKDGVDYIDRITSATNKYCKALQVAIQGQFDNRKSE